MRFAAAWLAISSVSLIAAAPAPSLAITDAAEFLRMVAAVRADANNYDKFKEPLRSTLEGKAFKLTLPLKSDSYGTGTIVDYDAGKLILGIKTPEAWSLRRGTPSDRLPVIVAAEKTRDLGSYVGQNAFGATAHVKSLKNEGAGIALVSSPKAMIRGGSFVAGMQIGGDKGWWFEQQMPPAEAKALAATSSVVIEGTYAKVSWGDVGFCDFAGSEATIDNPTEFYSEKCYVGANISRIAFVNDKTGTVLTEWTTAANPQVGAELWRGIRLGMSKSQVKAIWPAITDYGHLDLGGQSVSVRSGTDGVSSVEVQLPFQSTMDGSAYRGIVSQYGAPVASKCTSTSCQAKWNLPAGVSAYLTITGSLVYQATESPPPMAFTAN
jgi:hypothetical protein